MGRAIGERELDALRMSEPGEQCRRLERGRAQLDVRRATERERAGAEECAAQVRGAAAAPPDDAARRSLERRVPAVDDAGSREHAQGVVVALDVELVPRRSVEGPAPVGPDLRADPAVAEERERAPRRGAASEIEVQRPVAGAAEVQAPGGVEQRGELGAPIALALRRDRRELLANVLGRDHSSTPSSASSRRLTSTPVAP